MWERAQDPQGWLSGRRGGGRDHEIRAFLPSIQRQLVPDGLKITVEDMHPRVVL